MECDDGCGRRAEDGEFGDFGADGVFNFLSARDDRAAGFEVAAVWTDGRESSLVVR